MTRRAGSLLLAVTVVIALSGCNPVSQNKIIRLEDQVESILELHTFEHIYRDLVYFGEERSFLGIPTMDRAVLFSIDITVTAGLDLAAGLRITPDRTSRDRIYVVLPAATILSVDADEESINEYFIRERGGRIGLLELSDQLEQVKERTAADAVERGILEQAQTNGRAIVREFLHLAGFSEVVFAEPVDRDEEIQG
jgi:hypothetical protein